MIIVLTRNTPKNSEGIKKVNHGPAGGRDRSGLECPRNWQTEEFESKLGSPTVTVNQAYGQQE